METAKCQTEICYVNFCTCLSSGFTLQLLTWKCCFSRISHLIFIVLQAFTGNCLLTGYKDNKKIKEKNIYQQKKFLDILSKCFTKSQTLCYITDRHDGVNLNSIFKVYVLKYRVLYSEPPPSSFRGNISGFLWTSPELLDTKSNFYTHWSQSAIRIKD